MPTLILFLIIVILFSLAIRSLIKGKGSCGDCSCDCTIKQEMNESSHHRQATCKKVCLIIVQTFLHVACLLNF